MAKKREGLVSQVARLLAFLMANFKDEKFAKDGAVDTAIRLLRQRILIRPEIQAGDVVRLKSGGQEMTVTTVLGGRVAEVIWSSGIGGSLGQHLVPTMALVVVEKKRAMVELDRGFQTKDRL